MPVRLINSDNQVGRFTNNIIKPLTVEKAAYVGEGEANVVLAGNVALVGLWISISRWLLSSNEVIFSWCTGLALLLARFGAGIVWIAPSLGEVNRPLDCEIN